MSDETVNWGDLETKELLGKLLLVTQVVIPGVIQPALKAGDPRAENIAAPWEQHRVEILAELRKRGVIQNRVVKMNAAHLSVERK